MTHEKVTSWTANSVNINLDVALVSVSLSPRFSKVDKAEIVCKQLAAQIVPNLESFQYLLQQLMASEPEVPPQAENLTLVDAGWEFF